MYCMLVLIFIGEYGGSAVYTESVANILSPGYDDEETNIFVIFPSVAFRIFVDSGFSPIQPLVYGLVCSDPRDCFFAGFPAGNSILGRPGFRGHLSFLHQFLCQ